MKRIKKDIIKELRDHQTIMVVLKDDYVKELQKLGKKLPPELVGYISLNKRATSIVTYLHKQNIPTDKLLFVELVQEHFKTKKTLENCHYIISPIILEEIEREISMLLTEGARYIIFDAIDNLLIYEKRPKAKACLANVIKKIKATNTKAVFFTLGSWGMKSIAKDMKKMVDKVYDIKELI